LIAAAVVGVGACAGHHHVNTDQPPHPLAVEVKNNLTVPTELTVWVVQDGGGYRQMLGTVAGDQTKTFQFKPLNWGDSYRLVGQRQLAGPLRSPRFTVDNPTTGTVAWSVVPNLVSFYDVATDTTRAPAAGGGTATDTTHR
jgi:hypothetical protein